MNQSVISKMTVEIVRTKETVRFESAGLVNSSARVDNVSGKFVVSNCALLSIKWY